MVMERLLRRPILRSCQIGPLVLVVDVMSLSPRTSIRTATWTYSYGRQLQVYRTLPQYSVRLLRRRSRRADAD